MSNGEFLVIPISLKFYTSGSLETIQALNTSITAQRPPLSIIFLQLLQSLLYMCLIPLITVNNLLIIIASCLFKRLLTPDNLILTSLAVADLMVGVVAVPLSIFINLPVSREYMMDAEILCVSWMALTNFVMTSSLLNLFLLSVERFLAINFPLRYPVFLSNSRTLVLIAWVWMIALIFFLLPPYIFNTYNPDIHNLEVRCSVRAVMPEWYIVTIPILTVSVCLGVPAVLYVQVFFVVVKQLSSRNWWLRDSHRLTSTSSSSRRISRKRSRTIYSTAALMMLFIFLWIPHTIVSSPFFNPPLSPVALRAVRMWAQMLTFSNSAADTLVYAFCKTEYRRAISLILTASPIDWGRLMNTNIDSDVSITQPDRISRERRNTGFFHIDHTLAKEMVRLSQTIETLPEESESTSQESSSFLPRRYSMGIRTWFHHYLALHHTPSARLTHAKSTIV